MSVKSTRKRSSRYGRQSASTRGVGDDMPNLDESQQKAFDLSQDSAKQVITLSTGILALTITFFKDFAAGADSTSKTIMAISWLFYLISILAGIAHLFSLTAELDPKDSSRTPTLYGGT